MDPTRKLGSLEQGFRIGCWQVRPPAGEFRRVRRFGPLNGPVPGPRHVEPKAMRVLMALAARPGRFVSKDELIEAAWDGRPVTDDALSGAVCALRSALDDDARNPRYIETRSNVGYRLLQPVRAIAPVRWRWAAAAAAVAAVSAAAALFWQPAPDRRDAAAPRTIAVLPFLDLSGSGETRHLSAAMTEALILNLAQVPGLRVISRTSVMPYADYRGTAAALAEELDADLLVEGSVQALEGQLRVVAQLIEPYRDHHLWADSYDRALNDVLTLQQEIAQAVASEIGLALAAGQRAVPSLPAEDMHAYLLARYRLAESGVDSTEAALTHFERLARQHPDFAPAHLGVAEALLYLFKQHARPADALTQAATAAGRFEQLAGPSPESHRCIGQILLLADWDFGGAERRYRAAISLNPSDSIARSRYAWLLVALGRYDEAADEIHQVRLFDPLYYASPEMANLMLYAGQVDAAVREFERLDRTAQLDKVILRAMAVAYLAAGREAESRQTFVRMLLAAGQIGPERARALATLPSDELYRTILETKPFKSPIVDAGFHHLLGDTEAALTALELAVAGRDQHVIYLGALPEFAGLHGHPGFQALLAEIGVIARDPSHLRETRLMSAILSNPQDESQEN